MESRLSLIILVYMDRPDNKASSGVAQNAPYYNQKDEPYQDDKLNDELHGDDEQHSKPFVVIQ